jgi:hypothetical protein
MKKKSPPIKNFYIQYPIPPSVFCEKNKLSAMEYDVIKRMCRWRLNVGKGIEDLEKAKASIDILIKLKKEEEKEMKTDWKKTTDELPTDDVPILLCDKKGKMSVGTVTHLEMRTHIEDPVFPFWSHLPDKPDGVV